MHEINNVNKRLRFVRNFSNYIAVAIIVSGLTTLLVLAARGYDIDRTTGQVIKNGILLVESQPEGAEVKLDGRLEPKKTPDKYPIPEGSYNLKLTKDGFRDWDRQVDVIGSKVNWINYPLLIPQKLITTDIDKFDSALSIYQSDDLTHLIAMSKDFEIRYYDLGANSIKPVLIELPDRLFLLDDDDKPRGKIEFIDWSSNGEQLLVRYIVDNQDDVLLIDLKNINSSTSANLDRLHRQDFDDAQFASDDNFVLFDAGTTFVSEVGSTQVRSLSLSGTKTATMNPVVDSDWVYVKGEGLSFISRLSTIETPVVMLTADQPVTKLLAKEYEGKEFLVAQNQGLVRIYRGINLEDQTKNVAEKVIRSDEDATIEVSPNGRFVSVVAADNSEIYDLDTSKTYSLSIGKNDLLAWLDGYHLSFKSGSNYAITDFSGDNQYSMTEYQVEFGVFINSSRETIISLRRGSTGEIIIQGTKLTIE